MTNRTWIEKEQIYISRETGELVETHAEAMALYNEGHEIQIRYRYRFDGGTWQPWIDGPYWAH